MRILSTKHHFLLCVMTVRVVWNNRLSPPTTWRSSKPLEDSSPSLHPWLSSGSRLSRNLSFETIPDSPDHGITASSYVAMGCSDVCVLNDRSSWGRTVQMNVLHDPERVCERPFKLLQPGFLSRPGSKPGHGRARNWDLFDLKSPPCANAQSELAICVTRDGKYSQPRMLYCHSLPPGSLHVLGTFGSLSWSDISIKLIQNCVYERSSLHI